VNILTDRVEDARGEHPGLQTAIKRKLRLGCGRAGGGDAAALRATCSRSDGSDPAAGAWRGVSLTSRTASAVPR